MAPELDLPAQLFVTCAAAAIVVIAVAGFCSSLSRRLPSAALAWVSLLLAFGAPIFFATTRWCEIVLQGETAAWAWTAFAVYCSLALPVVINCVVGITKHRRYSFEHPSTFEIGVTDQTVEHQDRQSSWDGVGRKASSSK